MLRSELLNELAAALAKAQGEMDPAVKDSLNPHFKSKYADLASVHEAIKGPLSRNGLSVCQVVTVENNIHYLDSLLMHSSGQFIGGRMEILSKDKSAQALGSGITYARRYALGPLVGIASEVDDDGNAASPAQPPRRFTPPKIEPEVSTLFLGTADQLEMLRQKAKSAGVTSKEVFNQLRRAVMERELENVDSIISTTLVEIAEETHVNPEKSSSSS